MVVPGGQHRARRRPRSSRRVEQLGRIRRRLADPSRRRPAHGRQTSTVAVNSVRPCAIGNPAVVQAGATVAGLGTGVQHRRVLEPAAGKKERASQHERADQRGRGEADGQCHGREPPQRRAPLSDRRDRGQDDVERLGRGVIRVVLEPVGDALVEEAIGRSGHADRSPGVASAPRIDVERRPQLSDRVMESGSGRADRDAQHRRRSRSAGSRGGDAEPPRPGVRV